jgi:cytochrome c oxidase subunit 4
MDPQARSSSTHGHVLPIRTYLRVFGALVFLTALTVGVSYLDLGPQALFAALAIATLKMGLVVGYFMHLKFDTRFHLLVLLASFLFLGLFFGLTFADLGSREDVVAEQGTFTYVQEKKLEAQAKQTPGGEAAAAVKAAAKP